MTRVRRQLEDDDVEMVEIRAAVAARMPPDWAFDRYSITLSAPGVKANVIATAERLDPEFDTARYADQNLSEHFPGYEEVSFEAKPVFGGREGRMRRYRWRPEDGEQVTQIQLYCAELGRGYTVTATTRTGEFPGLEDQLMAVLEGIAFGESWTIFMKGDHESLELSREEFASKGMTSS